MSEGSAGRAVLGAAVTIWGVALTAVGAAQDSLPAPPASPPAAPPARTPIKVVHVKFEPFEGWDYEGPRVLRFTLFGDTTRPHSQLHIQLSRGPAEDEDVVELNIWLVDSTGRDTVKVGPDATVEPWTWSTGFADARRDVEWLVLRPTSWDSLAGLSPKRGVFRILVVAATAPKRRGLTDKFVLVDGDRP